MSICTDKTQHERFPLLPDAAIQMLDSCARNPCHCAARHGLPRLQLPRSGVQCGHGSRAFLTHQPLRPGRVAGDIAGQGTRPRLPRQRRGGGSAARRVNGQIGLKRGVSIRMRPRSSLRDGSSTGFRGHHVQRRPSPRHAAPVTSSCCAQSQHPAMCIERSEPGVPGLRDYAGNNPVEATRPRSAQHDRGDWHMLRLILTVQCFYMRWIQVLP